MNAHTDYAQPDRQALINSVQAATGAELWLSDRAAFAEARVEQLEQVVREARVLIARGMPAGAALILERALIT